MVRQPSKNPRRESNNLLTNAAKFTDVGGRIEVRAARDGDTVEISVTDNGIGLAPDALQNVFQMFVQIGPSLERTEAGLGIGLALAKVLVDLHGGRIAAESAGVGRGTTIRVWLPIAAARSDSIPPTTALDARVYSSDNN
jgi:signal transduction histidine kinase